MQQKQSEHVEKRLKRERKTKRQNGKNGPRQVKRRQDQLIERAKGEEFDPHFHQNEHNAGKRKKKKKKKMDGFSNRQWEKQHPNQRLDKVEECQEASTVNKETPTREDVLVSPADLREENNNETKEEEDTPPPVPMRKHAPVSEERGSAPPPPPPLTENDTQERESIPPPPPPLDENSAQERDIIPPPPPPLVENNETSFPRQSVAFPPTPYEFYQQKDGRDSQLLPPPPLLADRESTKQDFRESFLPPPPSTESDTIQPRKNLKAQRISTFILPPPPESYGSVDGRQLTPPPDYPDIDEKPETIIPAAPKPPPPPPPPILSATDNSSTANPMPDQVPRVPSADSTSPVGLFDSNSLLAMKKNLKQSKERKVEPVKSTKNNFDVHSIMTKALDSHRKFIEDSSSEEESDDYDSDSDWD